MHTDPPIHPRSLKNQAQVRIMAENAVLLFRLFEELKPFMVAGSTGVRIQEFCLAHFRRYGFRVLLQGYRDFPAQICVSRNEVAAHGLPDLRPLEPGDLVTVDLAGTRRGYCADAAWTYLIPGDGTEREGLRVAAWEACLAGVVAGGEQRRKGAIGKAVQETAMRHGVHVLSRFAGHGIGRFLHEAPQLAFLGIRQEGDVLDEGLVLNIEPILSRGPDIPAQGYPEAVIGTDGWSWVLPVGYFCAQFELSLSLGPGREWQVLNFADTALVRSTTPPF